MRRRAFSPLTRRRLANFRANSRGFWSLWIFLALFFASLFAEFIANDRPLLVSYGGHLDFPIFHDYTEADLGGDLPIEADFRDAEVEKRIDAKGWIVWPPIPFDYRTINFHLPSPAPSPPDRREPGSAPTIKAAMCWRGSFTAFAFPCCSVSC